MKLLLSMACYFAFSLAYAQEADRRAALEIEGNFNQLCVLPDGQVWIATLIGELYHSDDFGTNWHYASLPYRPDRSYSFESLHFFDARHAIMIAENSSVMATADDAGSWQTTLSGKGALFDAATDAAGNAWVVGDKGIWHSLDFGATWNYIPIRTSGEETFHHITMSDNGKGILYGNGRHLYVTDNYWKTTARIKVPKSKEGYVRPSQVVIVNGMMALRNRDQLYLSKFGKDDWQTIDLHIKTLIPDPVQEKLFAISNKQQLVEINEAGTYTILGSDLPEDAAYTFNNQILFAAAHDFLYRFEKGTLSKQAYFTTDHRIPEPYKITEGVALSLGSYAKHLYTCRIKDRNWQRIDILPFDIWEIKQEADSSAILWDGEAHHRYDLLTHRLSTYQPKNPLSEFLKAPLKGFSITTTEMGSNRYSVDSICFSRSMDSLYCSQRLFEVDDNRSRTSNCSLNITAKKVSQVLQSLNTGYGKPVVLQEFNISGEDRKAYLQRADSKVKYADGSRQERKALSDYYTSFATTQDTAVSLLPFFRQRGYGSNGSQLISVRFVNEKDEVLLVTNTDLFHQVPWHLPWLVHFDHFTYKVDDVSFSRFIDGCTPGSFMGKASFNNADLLMDLADFFREGKDK